MAGTVIVVIPAHDEAGRIGPVVERARLELPVIVVDDGSTDATAETAAAAGASVVRQAPNQGKGAALRAGFRYAMAEGCEAVVTLDADGQHDPAEIPRFLAAWRGGQPALVIGQRDFSAMPPVRRISNSLGGLAFSWAVGRSIPDNQSGFRLIGRSLLEVLVGSSEDGFEFEVEMITTAIRRGDAIAWVPISTIYAGETSHIRPTAHLSNFLRVTRDARRAVRER
jgi:glycosyltransferase involved in cell wall biosynthesis